MLLASRILASCRSSAYSDLVDSLLRPRRPFSRSKQIQYLLQIDDSDDDDSDDSGGIYFFEGGVE